MIQQLYSSVYIRYIYMILTRYIRECAQQLKTRNTQMPLRVEWIQTFFSHTKMMVYYLTVQINYNC